MFHGPCLQACHMHSTSLPELGSLERNDLAHRTCNKWRDEVLQARLQNHHGIHRRTLHEERTLHGQRLSEAHHQMHLDNPASVHVRSATNAHVG